MNASHLLNEFHHPKVISLQGALPETLRQPVQHHESGFNPYELNGGNCVAVVQDNVAVIAADTRLSRGFSILKRDGTKIHKLNDSTYILSAGAYADVINLWKILDQRIELFELNHGEKMSSSAVASMLSRLLYERRFFPYYTFNIVVGFNEQGEALLWNYDAVGNYERRNHSSSGNANDLMEPLLDNQLDSYNAVKKPRKKHADELVELVVDVFQSTAERDITCGDSVEVIVLKEGHVMLSRHYPLRFD